MPLLWLQTGSLPLYTFHVGHAGVADLQCVLVKDLVKGVSVWEASINDVKGLPSQVRSHVCVAWGVIPYDFSLAISFALWLRVVRVS